MLLALLIASSLGQRIAVQAGREVGLDRVRGGRDDCSGFADVVYRRAGVDLAELNVPALHHLARERGALHAQPHPGDLVFFRDTTSRGGLTHVGIVERVGPAGRATFVHRIRSGIVRSRLDLRHPHRRATNDVLRRGPRPRLASELLAGFASPDRLTASRARTPCRRACSGARSPRGSGRSRRRSSAA